MAEKLIRGVARPTFSVEVDDQRGELHFKTSGLFDAESMTAFLADASRKVGPVLAAKGKMRALGDLTEFVTQTREIGETMAKTLANAEQDGIERTAIIINSAILKMQYQRVSEGRHVEIFSNREEALRWLRS